MMKNLLLYIVSIHRNFNQNWFINECVRKTLAKNHSHTVPESLSHIATLLFVRCRSNKLGFYIRIIQIELDYLFF